MSAKFFCDCCGQEYDFRAQMEQVPFKQHIIEMAEDKSEGIHLGYGDYQLIPVSFKSINKDLCHKCYNEIMLTAYTKLLELQKEYSE